MSLWSAEQQYLLEAMGYTPYARAGVAAPRAADMAVSAESVPAAGAHEVLRQALRRAAGGGGYEHLIDDLEALRRDPARKRALWPRLRALRRPQP